MIDALSSKLDKAFVIYLLTNPGEGADFSTPEAKVQQAAEKLSTKGTASAVPHGRRPMEG